jgi:GNAT superfamily N-acetyltransferase
MSDRVEIQAARDDDDFAGVERLIASYANALPSQLAEEATCEPLPGAYSPPEGELLLARIGSDVAGCAAMRRFSEKQCEFKRLFVDPQFRGRGIALQLVKSLEAIARQRGYQEILLDTFEEMAAARRLYTAHGFEVIPPYRPVRFERLVYMRKRIAQ